MKLFGRLALILIMNTTIYADVKGDPCIRILMGLKKHIRSASATLSTEHIARLRATLETAYTLEQAGSEEACLKMVAPVEAEFLYKVNA